MIALIFRCASFIEMLTFAFDVKVATDDKPNDFESIFSYVF
jgi:hypothetical protein